MEENDVVKSLAALAQPLRLRVFRALVVAGPAGLTPGGLAMALDIAATTLSCHLKELSHATRRQACRPGHHQRAKHPQAQCLGQCGQGLDNVFLFHTSIIVALLKAHKSFPAPPLRLKPNELQNAFRCR